MRRTVKKNISEIRHLVKHMPRTLNEAVFDEFSGYNDITEDEELTDPQLKKPMPQDGMGAGTQPQAPTNVEAPMPDQQPQQEPGPEVSPEMPGGEQPIEGDMPEDNSEGDALNVEQFVDDIRKKSLRGMAQLAETPEDERYQLLKKIWQICDKKPEQQTAFGNPNAGAQPQPRRI